MKSSKRRPNGIAHRYIPCNTCGKRFHSTVLDGDDMCAKCKAENGVNELLASPSEYGEVICWKDGKEYEKLTCMERKHHATQRFNDGKDYIMPWCRMCGSTERTTPRVSANMKPLTKTGSIQGKSDKTYIVLCEICGRKLKSEKGHTKRCKVCDRKVRAEREKERARVR